MNFEKIKAAQKLKEIPVARLASVFSITRNPDRLILKVPENIEKYQNEIIAIDLSTGKISNHWREMVDETLIRNYYDVLSL